MASSNGQVTLRGRFPSGTKVALVKVSDGAVLRAEGGRTLERKRVGKDGSVQFTKDVEVGGRYFITGNVRGQPLEVRVTGRDRQADEDSAGGQAPVQVDRVRLSDGSWLDEAPEKEKTPSSEVGPGPSQQQVPKRQWQRSSTARGSAHPHDPGEPAPYPSQEDTNGVLQASDTEKGRATPIDLGPQRQDQVPAGTWQRSATPKGVATPIPPGDAVEVQKVKESAEAKAKRGEPVRAAAEPLGVKAAGKRAKTAADKVSDDTPSDGDGSGRDALGQPLPGDVAAASGQEPAKSPEEPVRRRSQTSKSKSSSTTASKRKG